MFFAVLRVIVKVVRNRQKEQKKHAQTGSFVHTMLSNVHFLGMFFCHTVKKE